MSPHPKLPTLLLFVATTCLWHFSQSQSLDFTSYGKDDGLAARSSFSAVQDQLGFMWFGTNNGLQRFDGETFIHYPPSDDSTGLPDGQIWALHNDGLYLWLGTQAGGLVRFDPQIELFTTYLFPDSLGFGDRPLWITQIYSDDAGALWLATRRHALSRFDPASGEWRVYTHDGSDPGPSNGVGAIHVDAKGNFWVGTVDGLFLFDPTSGAFTAHSFGGDREPNIANIYSTPDGKLWCGTFGTGLYSYHPETKEVQRYHPKGQGKYQFDAQIVYKIRPSAEGHLWLGTWGAGLCRFNTDSGEKEFLSRDSEGEFPLSNNYVFGVYQSPEEVLWVMTDSKLNKASLRQLSIERIRYPENLSRLSQDIDGTLWCTKSALYQYNNGDWAEVATIDQLADRVTDVETFHNKAGHWTPLLRKEVLFVDRQTKRSTIYPIDAYQEALKGEHISNVCIDEDDNVWLATEYGAYIFSPERQRFVAAFPDHVIKQIRDYGTRAIQVGDDHTVWIATREGLFSWDRNTNEVSGYFKGQEANSLRDDNIKDMVIGPEGRIWVGTVGGGLQYLDPVADTVYSPRWPDGFILTDVNNLMFDTNGNLWVSHIRGVIVYDPAAEQSIMFDRRDGLLSDLSYEIREFPDGKIGIGNAVGASFIDPDFIYSNPTPAQAIITKFSMYNDPVDYAVPDMPIDRQPSYVTDIDLRYSDEVWSFDFRPLHYDEPELNKMQYMLDGFDREWIDARGKRSTTYTNLNPGSYVFKVRAANCDGLWQKNFTSVSIYIAPPWWQTWWAISLFVLLAIAAALAIRQYELRRIRLANALKIEKLEADRLKELDQVKSDFFANISHEFRTPLTVIMGQIDDAIELTSNNVSKGLSAAYSNAKKLLVLVNQILDLSKIEAGALELNTQQEDIIPLLKNQLFAFESLAKKNGIKLEYASDVKSAMVSFESAKLEKVLSNLISNALKFTGNPGLVRMNVSAPRTDQIQVAISDNGIGIPEEQLDRIFNRFHQVDGSKTRGYEGTGIGLTLVSELVRLHNGTVTVHSAEGSGSTFTVMLPAESVDMASESRSSTEVEEKQSFNVPVVTPDNENPVLLIVEDNFDVREYIRSCMEDRFKVVEAGDGVEGLEKAAEHMPDLIISDIMMPRMDGFDFSARIRADVKTSHVPLIMLTAQASDETRMKGLSLGIDDFLTKPFRRNELVARADNLIAMRKKLQEHYANFSSIRPSEIKVESVDDQFVKQVLTFIDENLSDPAVGVEQIAESVSMSTSQLGRKTKALLDITPGQLLRKLRLTRASDLLRGGAGTVSEVCYQSGFSDVTSFTRSFKREFGVAPSQFTGLAEE